jgi:hypothetical protein
MSDATVKILFATAIMGIIAATIQLAGRWFELQAARIKRETANIEKPATDKPKDTSSAMPPDLSGWVLRYIWQTNKFTVFMLLVLIAVLPCVYTVYRGYVTNGLIAYLLYVLPITYGSASLLQKQAVEVYVYEEKKAFGRK